MSVRPKVRVGVRKAIRIYARKMTVATVVAGQVMPITTVDQQPSASSR